jgi:serine/threonine protein kinase
MGRASTLVLVDGEDELGRRVWVADIGGELRILDLRGLVGEKLAGRLDADAFVVRRDLARDCADGGAFVVGRYRDLHETVCMELLCLLELDRILDPEEIMLFISDCKGSGNFVDLSPDTVLCTQNDVSDGFMYLLYEGELEILCDEERIALIGRPSIVGEIAVLSAVYHRTATVVCTKESRLVPVSGKAMRSLARHNGGLYRTFANLVAERLRVVDRVVDEHTPFTSDGWEREIVGKILRSDRGSYTVSCEIGEGGTSRVFIALFAPRAGAREEGGFVVLKILDLMSFHQPDKTIERIYGEVIRTIEYFRDGSVCGIIPVLDSHVQPVGSRRLFFYSMPFYEKARSLDGFLDEEWGDGRLRGVDERMALVKDIAYGLSNIHAMGVMHMDVKPQNILVMVDERGLMETSFIDLDFARRVGREADFENVVGTVGYASPEQLTAGAAVDFRSDVFAFGVLVYEILSARSPFRSAGDGSIDGYIGAVARGGVPDLLEKMGISKSDDDYAAWLRHSAAASRCMAFRARDRFASMHEVMEYLGYFERSGDDRDAEDSTTRTVDFRDARLGGGEWKIEYVEVSFNGRRFHVRKKVRS